MSELIPNVVLARSTHRIRKTPQERNVRVLFIVPSYHVSRSDRPSSKKQGRGFLAFPYGVLTLATYLKRRAQCLESAHVLDLNVESDVDARDRVHEALENNRPGIVAISLMFDVSYRYVSDLAAQVKKHSPQALVIMGGAVVTAAYEDIMAEQVDIDALCYAEGEKALSRLVDAEDIHEELQGNPWITRESLAAGRAPQTDYIEDLDRVIDIDYSLIDIEAYSMKEAFSPFAAYRNERDVKQFFIVTSRGCPFKCVFCAEPSYHGRSMRYASVDAVIAHVDQLVSRHGMNVLTIYDDQLLLDRDRAKELFRRLAPFKLRIEMPNGVTAIFIDDEMASLMKVAGVDSIILALESGSAYVLKSIIKKPIRLDKLKGIIDSLHKQRIFVQAFFINGFPGEREEHRQATVEFIKTHGVDWSLFNFATPLRGTELYKVCKDNGWIEPKYLGIGAVDMTEYIIRAPGIDPEHIRRQTYMMNLDVNFVNNRRMQNKDYPTAIRCFTEVIERHPTHAFGHYFLAQALEAAQLDPAAVARHRAMFHHAVDQDPAWRDYAIHFGLLDRENEAIQSRAHQPCAGRAA